MGDLMDDSRTRMLRDRAGELAAAGDDEIRDRFWRLCESAVAPLTELARTHTTPSVERSVLLRMGVDSVTAREVVARIVAAGLLGKGAGHVLVRIVRRDGGDVRAAAARLAAAPDVLDGLFPPGGRR
jgi:D-ornithine 4,5-aminomutase subunit alpha